MRLWLGIATGLLGALAIWLAALGQLAPGPTLVPAAVVPAATDHATEPATLSVDARQRGVGLPVEVGQRYPPGSQVHLARPLEPRDFSAGIGCPGGGFLPLLNGVPFAQPLHRNVERDGPVPAVIAKRTDAEGFEWWVHADGSETTTRWMTKVVGGVDVRDVRTDHAVPARNAHTLPPAAGEPGRR
jgi:hypothetical protein